MPNNGAGIFPPEPLLAAVAHQNGGLPALAQQVRLRAGLPPTSGVRDETTPELCSPRDILTRAQRQGTLLLREWVDWFCCTYLQVHPCAVYGEDWFDFSEEYLDRATVAELTEELHAAEDAGQQTRARTLRIVRDYEDLVPDVEMVQTYGITMQSIQRAVTRYHAQRNEKGAA